MKRPIAALVAALLTTAAAAAQPYPGDTGTGEERGIEQLNNSGQVGTATLFRRGPSTRVVVELHGTPGGAQSVRIYRGPSCDDLAGKPQYFLTDMRAGRSVSTVSAPEEKLLSGNYNVVVFSSNQAGARSTACGHLYT
jgi:Cu/Zn superoxide dismutase